MRTGAKTEPVILLAEDQPNDVILTRIAMETVGLRNPLHAVCDGEETINYLQGSGRYVDRQKFPLPGLLLLDLKMPKVDGFGVLAWLQPKPQFDHIAKVILSSSNLEPDVTRAANLGADDYLVKPNRNSDLAEMLLVLRDRWIPKQ